MDTKILNRKDAFDGKNWIPMANSASIECIFEENDDMMRAVISGDELAVMKGPEDLAVLMKKAIDKAQPVQILWPIKESFMSMCFQKPPVWKQVMEMFRINIGTTIFTFGDVIYNPAQAPIPDDYIKHEEVHAEQQGHNPEGAGRWWARVFQDQYFRIDQEARAYAVQYDWWCLNGPKKQRNNREERAIKLHNLSTVLASPTYGSVVSVAAAKKLIKSFSKTK